MHEAAVLRDLRSAILRVAAAENVARIGAVSIWIGALSHVTAPSIRSHWTEMVDGTPAQGARLDLEVSRDPQDPRAADVVLRHLVTEEP